MVSLLDAYLCGCCDYFIQSDLKRYLSNVRLSCLHTELRESVIRGRLIRDHGSVQPRGLSEGGPVKRTVYFLARRGFI